MDKLTKDAENMLEIADRNVNSERPLNRYVY